MKINIAHRLMQSLFYPTALGAGIIPLLLKVPGYNDFYEAVTDLRNYFVILLIVYYSLSFLANEMVVNKYNWKLFLIDSFEVVVIIFAFNALGLFDLSSVPDKWSPLYIWLLVVPVLHFIWNIEIENKEKRFYYIIIARCVIAVIGIVIGDSVAFYNVIALIILTLLTALYIFISYLKKLPAS